MGRIEERKNRDNDIDQEICICNGIEFHGRDLKIMKEGGIVKIKRTSVPSRGFGQ